MDPMRGKSLHSLGVICGLAAGAWLGSAEAPTKLVTAGYSPFLISMMMVTGVFVARWTLPMFIKGSGYVYRDFREKPHLVIWAILAGMLWVIANTLTIFAIRDVGLSIAFPLWNTNSLVGLFFGWLLFNELRGAGGRQKALVLGGAALIVAGAYVLAYATAKHSGVPAHKAAAGILAALGAGLLWGAMYIPYRKAYLSGMNPLSFVTLFTVGEILTMGLLAMIFLGGPQALSREITMARPALFWLFLGGFFWVIGDLFQQYAAKYLGIGRGIPLSNTNQLWGLAWGALVFGELAGNSATAIALVVAGSLLMVFGAVAISRAEAGKTEKEAWKQIVRRECGRYGLDEGRLEAAMRGEETQEQSSARPWYEYAIGLAAIGLFAWLAFQAEIPEVPTHPGWMSGVLAATLLFLLGGGWLLWKRTRFS
jgi:drug/metabolite transporter (DMT)-like permease